jgi:hypothetical protein
VQSPREDSENPSDVVLPTPTLGERSMDFALLPESAGRAASLPLIIVQQEVFGEDGERESRRLRERYATMPTSPNVALIGRFFPPKPQNSRSG